VTVRSRHELSERWLRYEARNGVVKTFFNHDGDIEALSEFLFEALEMSDANASDSSQPVYRVLDSFLTTLFTQSDERLIRGFTDKLIKRARNAPLQILLANPDGEFARARTRSLGRTTDTRKELTKGLRFLLESLAGNYENLFSDPDDARDLSYEAVLDIINSRRDATRVEIRLLDMMPSGPMFIFPPVMVYGRFCAGVNSNVNPWNLLVEDKECDGKGLFGVYTKEFTYLWTNARMSASSTPSASPSLPADDGCDIALICALQTPELAKVFDVVGSEQWASYPRRWDDVTPYSIMTFRSRRGTQLRVIAAATNQMGMPTAAVLATKMILRFKPRLVAHVGIAAGLDRKKQKFGDVLAAEETVDHGAGKDDTLPRGFRPDNRSIPIDPGLKARLQRWVNSRPEVLGDVLNGWPDKPPHPALNLHLGRLASGAAVVINPKTVERVTKQSRNMLGIDMEAYGVHVACREALSPGPLFLCMKSVSDFANQRKNDRWRHYAAYTAAQVCHRFLYDEWEDLFPSAAGRTNRG